MRVVITGGSGLIGRALARALVESGAKAEILSRNPERVTDLPPGAVAVRWDGQSAGALMPRLESAEAVVNLAGENIGDGRWSRARKVSIRDSRLRVTEALAEALRRVDQRPATLVQASAVGFYGSSGDEPVTESSAGGFDFLAGVCRDWEAASAGVESFGVRRVVIRSGVVLAAEGGALPRMMLPFKLFAGGSVGSGEQWCPWIHLRDETRAIRFLLDRHDINGVFNLSAPNPVTNRDLARALGEILRRPSYLPTPAAALKLVLGEMSTLVLDGQRALPTRLLESGFEFEFAQIRPALEDLLAETGAANAA